MFLSLMFRLIPSRCIDKVVSLCPRLSRFPGITQFTQFPWTIFLRGRFRLRYVYAVVWLHTCPGPYFEVELVFIFFLPFVNAPGEIHRGEMVFGPMALRESTFRCRVGYEALPPMSLIFPLFEVVCLLNVSFKVLGSTSREDSSREEPSEQCQASYRRGTGGLVRGSYDEAYRRGTGGLVRGSCDEAGIACGFLCTGL